MIDGRVVDAGYLEPSRVAFGVLVQLNNDGNVRECKAVEMRAHNHWLIEAPRTNRRSWSNHARKIRLRNSAAGKNALATCFRHDAYTLFTDEER